MNGSLVDASALASTHPTWCVHCPYCPYEGQNKYTLYILKPFYFVIS